MLLVATQSCLDLALTQAIVMALQEASPLWLCQLCLDAPWLSNVASHVLKKHAQVVQQLKKKQGPQQQRLQVRKQLGQLWLQMRPAAPVALWKMLSLSET